MNFYVHFVFHWSQVVDGMHQRTQNPVEMSKNENKTLNGCKVMSFRRWLAFIWLISLSLSLTLVEIDYIYYIFLIGRFSYNFFYYTYFLFFLLNYYYYYYSLSTVDIIALNKKKKNNQRFHFEWFIFRYCVWSCCHIPATTTTTCLTSATFLLRRSNPFCIGSTPGGVGAKETHSISWTSKNNRKICIKMWDKSKREN